MMIVNDVADVFVPFVDGFLVGYDEAEETLTRLAKAAANVRTRDCASDA